MPGVAYRARSGDRPTTGWKTDLLEGSQGNDLMDYSKEQVITIFLTSTSRTWALFISIRSAGP
ncbi:hypothetical protein ACLK1S_01995 [Escherichia coli]